MSVKLFKIKPATMLAAAVLAWSISGFSTWAYAQGCCGGGQHGSSHAGHGGLAPVGVQPGGRGGHVGHGGSQVGSLSQAFPRINPTGQSQPMPHGGQSVWVKPLVVEVVYRPQEICVYIYGPWPRPRSAKGVTGEVLLQRYNDKRVNRVALQYVATPTGEQDYLSAAADLSEAQEKNPIATIKLKNLPVANHSTAEFTQAVVMSQPKPVVTLAQLDKSDETGIARQQVCPVTGARLGSMGDPVKVLIDNRPLYLCCQGCVNKVKNDPEKVLAKVGQLPKSQ